MNKSRVSHGRTTGPENSRSNSILAGDHLTHSVNREGSKPVSSQRNNRLLNQANSTSKLLKKESSTSDIDHVIESR